MVNTLLILALFFFLLFSPLTAWAYFDPGFGGYLVNSLLSVIVTGFAFVSAAVIYFFRTVIGQRFLSLWQKHKRLCHVILLSALGTVLLSATGVGWRFLLRTFLHPIFSFKLIRAEIVPYLLQRAFVDPNFDKHLSIFFILLTVISFAFVCTMIIFLFPAITGQRFLPLCKKLRKYCFISLLGVLCMGSVFLKPFFIAYNNQPIYPSHSTGAHILDFQRMSEGYSLFQGILINEKGRIVKQWSSFSLGILDKNGDYYGQQNDKAPIWGRYTWDNRVIWEKHFLIHHQIYLSPKGTIFTFTKETHLYNNNKVDFDVILEFDKNGKELQRFSFWDHLKEFLPYHNKFTIDAAFPLLLLWSNPFKGHSLVPYDYFHLNSIFIIPPNPLENKNPAFRPGNWLISIMHASMLFILDQDTKRILWHAVANEIEGGLEGQHSASMLADGNILLFDNGFNRRASRILIIDPLTLQIKWQYNNKNFFSESEGSAQALPNGNILVTESMKGYLFELTPDKKIVWDFYYPANIYHANRYPKEMINPLLRGSL